MYIIIIKLPITCFHLIFPIEISACLMINIMKDVICRFVGEWLYMGWSFKVIERVVCSLNFRVTCKKVFPILNFLVFERERERERERESTNMIIVYMYISVIQYILLCLLHFHWLLPLSLFLYVDLYIWIFFEEWGCPCIVYVGDSWLYIFQRTDLQGKISSCQCFVKCIKVYVILFK